MRATLKATLPLRILVTILVTMALAQAAESQSPECLTTLQSCEVCLLRSGQVDIRGCGGREPVEDVERLPESLLQRPDVSNLEAPDPGRGPRPRGRRGKVHLVDLPGRGRPSAVGLRPGGADGGGGKAPRPDLLPGRADRTSGGLHEPRRFRQGLQRFRGRVPFRVPAPDLVAAAAPPETAATPGRAGILGNGAGGPARRRRGLEARAIPDPPPLGRQVRKVRPLLVAKRRLAGSAGILPARGTPVTRFPSRRDVGS